MRRAATAIGGVLLTVGACGERSPPVAPTVDTIADEQTNPAIDPLGWHVDPAPAATRVVLEATMEDEPGTLRVEVVVRDCDDLHGIAGHLRYDPTALELLDINRGQMDALLGDDAVSSRVLARDSPPGRILLGATAFRRWTSAHKGLHAARWTWATLRFRTRKVGTSQLAFDPVHSLVRNTANEGFDVFWGSAQITTFQVKP